jgi:hypothetical protein
MQEPASLWAGLCEPPGQTPNLVEQEPRHRSELGANLVARPRVHPWAKWPCNADSVACCTHPVPIKNWRTMFLWILGTPENQSMAPRGKLPLHGPYPESFNVRVHVSSWRRAVLDRVDQCTSTIGRHSDNLTHPTRMLPTGYLCVIVITLDKVREVGGQVNSYDPTAIQDWPFVAASQYCFLSFCSDFIFSLRCREGLVGKGKTIHSCVRGVTNCLA